MEKCVRKKSSRDAILPSFSIMGRLFPALAVLLAAASVGFFLPPDQQLQVKQRAQPVLSWCQEQYRELESTVLRSYDALLSKAKLQQEPAVKPAPTPIQVEEPAVVAATPAVVVPQEEVAACRLSGKVGSARVSSRQLHNHCRVDRWEACGRM